VFSLQLPTAQGAGLKKFSGVWANSGNVYNLVCVRLSLRKRNFLASFYADDILYDKK